jgi:hypothetical protein
VKRGFEAKKWCFLTQNGRFLAKNCHKTAKIGDFLLLISKLCVFVWCSIFATYVDLRAEKVIIYGRGGGGLDLFQAETGAEEAAEKAGSWIEFTKSYPSGAEAPLILLALCGG